MAAKEAVNLDQLPELLVQAPSGRVTELTTMLKQTPPDILSQIESLKLGQEASKNSAFEAIFERIGQDIFNASLANW